MDRPFSLEFTTSMGTTVPPSSKTELLISGLKVYIYGLYEARQQGYTDIAVLYHVHGRERDYRVSERFAHEVLHLYRSHGSLKRMGLIVVAFDARNHGERTINDKLNMGWDEGNELHAQDMLSVISGCAYDVELLIDYLPTYLPEFKTFCNIMSGQSLGGHTAWRLATSSSIYTRGKLHGLAIIIGSPNLSALLLSRLGVDLSALKVPLDKVYDVPYDDLSAVLTESQRERWPQALSELIARFDRETDTQFPRDLPVYILNGKQDMLVPAKFTAPWVAKRRADGYRAIEYFVQENAGHECTSEMVDAISQWLIRSFAGDDA